MLQRMTALRRWAILGSLTGFCALVLGVLLLADGVGAAGPAGGRISFQIATGPTSGAFFPVGEAIADLASHPAGVDRCSKPGVCGPAGLIMTARTSQGTVDNIGAVNSGMVESGLARGDAVAQAVRGEGAFHKGRRGKPHPGDRITLCRRYSSGRRHEFQNQKRRRSSGQACVAGHGGFRPWPDFPRHPVCLARAGEKPEGHRRGPFHRGQADRGGQAGCGVRGRRGYRSRRWRSSWRKARGDWCRLTGRAAIAC